MHSNAFGGKCLYNILYLNVPSNFLIHFTGRARCAALPSPPHLGFNKTETQAFCFLHVNHEQRTPTWLRSLSTYLCNRMNTAISYQLVIIQALFCFLFALFPFQFAVLFPSLAFPPHLPCIKSRKPCSRSSTCPSSLLICSLSPLQTLIKSVSLRPCPHVFWCSWKLRFIFYLLAFRTHINGALGHYTRPF